MGKEKQLENQFKRFLESRGIYPLGVAKQDIIVAPRGYYDKRWGGGQFTKSGLPDMYIVIDGKMLEVELKVESKPTLLQLRCLDQILTAGTSAYILVDTIDRVVKLKSWILKNYPEYSNLCDVVVDVNTLKKYDIFKNI